MFHDENDPDSGAGPRNWPLRVQPLAPIDPNAPWLAVDPLKPSRTLAPHQTPLEIDIAVAKSRLRRLNDDAEYDDDDVFYEASPVFPPSAPKFCPTPLTESLKPYVEVHFKSHMDRPLLPDDAPLVFEGLDAEFCSFVPDLGPMAHMVDLEKLDPETTLLKIWEYELGQLDRQIDEVVDRSLGYRLMEGAKSLGSFFKNSFVPMSEEEYNQRYPWAAFIPSESVDDL